MAAKKPSIGLGQARQLCQMPHNKLLRFLAEGLPAILTSSQSLNRASEKLRGSPREADILKGLAKEEAAKALILMDVARCPVKLLPSKIGRIMGTFYDHLGRLIYAEAVSWRPVHIRELRGYVDHLRKSHYVEGSVGEYIVPNWYIYQRESKLYVDVEAQDDGSLQWSVPFGSANLFPWSGMMPALGLIEAMSALGLFTVSGLQATSEVWNQVTFTGDVPHTEGTRLVEILLQRLVEEGVPGDAATDAHVRTLYDGWQMPMYDFDFGSLNVPIEELEAERDSLLWFEGDN